MPKKLALFFLLFVIAAAVHAQTESQPAKKIGRPNIPGTLAVELAYNFPKEVENFNTNMFGSRTFNAIYFYDKRIGQSKFSVHPGIGFGLQRFKFNNDRTLGYVAGPDSPYDTLRMIPVTSVTGSISGLKKSMLITNYIDIPVELRFNTNPNDLGRSFKVSLGFKFGVLYDSFTKLKYRQEGETKKLKDKQNYQLNPIRYGAYLRVGAGNLSVFGYYNISTLFEKDKGPVKSQGPAQDINYLQIGLSFAAF
jgi:hypothetical protein